MQVKERVVQNDWSFAVQAKKYTEWMEAQVGGGLGGQAGRMPLGVQEARMVETGGLGG